MNDVVVVAGECQRNKNTSLILALHYHLHSIRRGFNGNI